MLIYILLFIAVKKVNVVIKYFTSDSLLFWAGDEFTQTKIKLII